jgi:Superfamily II DNA helicase
LQLALPKKAAPKLGRPGGARADLAPEELALFEQLRALRREIAESEDIPAYQVFNDAVLREMAQHKPQNDGELLAINGVGQSKLARFGFEFLNLLRRVG